MSSKKYIIYKGTGGLVHMLCGLDKAIKIAINEKRILVIDTIKHACFKSNLSDYFIINEKNLIIEENYDSIIDNNYKGLKLEEIRDAYPKCKGQSYLVNDVDITSLNLNSNDKILVYAGCGYKTFIKKIKLKNEIINNIKEKFKCYNNVNYIAIHFRNTDMKNDIEGFIKKIKNHKFNDEKNNKVNLIFLATDDHKAFNIFKKRIQEYKWFRVVIPENHNGENLHYHVKNKKELVLNTLYDMYMILNSRFFIPSFNSGISKWCIEMIKDNNNIFNLKTNSIIKI